MIGLIVLGIIAIILLVLANKATGKPCKGNHIGMCDDSPHWPCRRNPDNLT